MHRTKQMSGYQGQSGVFAPGVSDSGGSVGCADNVIHDSPPLTGCPGSTERNFNELATSGIPGYTAANGSMRHGQWGDYENA
jgi:hypothetical protein